MMYQVLTWSRDLDQWVPFSAPTTRWEAVRLPLATARRYWAGAVLVEAGTIQELAHQIQHVQQSGSKPAAAVSFQLAPQIAGVQVLMEQTVPLVSGPQTALDDDRRWALENGPGGDHDTPYRFELPPEAAVRYRWLRLLAQVNRRAAMGEVVA